MKKTLFLLPLVLLALTGCNSNATDNKVSDSPKQSVTLSAENFSTYVATNSSSALLNNSYNDVIYYTYFNGADYCKFVNCTVTYKYVSNQSTEGTEETIKLTLSGDGETNPYFARSQNRYTYYHAVVTAASGTVEVYR